MEGRILNAKIYDSKPAALVVFGTLKFTTSKPRVWLIISKVLDVRTFLLLSGCICLHNTRRPIDRIAATDELFTVLPTCHSKCPSRTEMHRLYQEHNEAEIPHATVRRISFIGFLTTAHVTGCQNRRTFSIPEKCLFRCGDKRNDSALYGFIGSVYLGTAVWISFMPGTVTIRLAPEQEAPPPQERRRPENQAHLHIYNKRKLKFTTIRPPYVYTT